jgi:hypothetical protein
MYRATKLIFFGVLMYFTLLNNFAAAKLLKEHLTGLNCQRAFLFLSFPKLKTAFRSGFQKQVKNAESTASFI